MRRKLDLGCCITVLCRHAVPLGSLCVVLLDANPTFKGLTHLKLCLTISTLCLGLKSS